jgi:hypothetical protein
VRIIDTASPPSTLICEIKFKCLVFERNAQKALIYKEVIRLKILKVGEYVIVG